MNKRIMLLEDDDDIRHFIEMVLEEDGYTVISLDRFALVDEIMEFEPEIILTDIRLKNGYGHELCKTLKSNAITANIPVIFISAADNLKKIARDYSADGYLSKPFEVDDLLSVIKKHGGAVSEY